MELQSKYIGKRTEPAATGNGWEHMLWHCTLSHEGRTLEIPWRAGMAHVLFRRYVSWQKPAGALEPRMNHYGPGRDAWTYPKPPSLFDVLYSLLSDARGYDNARGFGDWASEYGFSEDSISAEATYRQCGEGARNLRRVLGGKLYDELAALDEDELAARLEPAPSMCSPDDSHTMLRDGGAP